MKCCTSLGTGDWTDRLGSVQYVASCMEGCLMTTIIYNVMTSCEILAIIKPFDIGRLLKTVKYVVLI